MKKPAEHGFGKLISKPGVHMHRHRMTPQSGATTLAKAIAHGMSKQGYRVLVICPMGGPYYKKWDDFGVDRLSAAVVIDRGFYRRAPQVIIIDDADLFAPGDLNVIHSVINRSARFVRIDVHIFERKE